MQLPIKSNINDENNTLYENDTAMAGEDNHELLTVQTQSHYNAIEIQSNAGISTRQMSMEGGLLQTQEDVGNNLI